MRSDDRSVDAALELIEEGYSILAKESFDTQTHRELLGVQSRLEAVSWKQPAIAQKLIARLADRLGFAGQARWKESGRSVGHPVAHLQR